VLAVVRGEDGSREAVLARFGLAPAWAKLRGGPSLINARDARMTMGVYAQLLKLGDGNVELLEALMGCTRDEARGIFEAEEVLRTSSERAQKKPPHLASTSSWGARKVLVCRRFNEAAEGTRTLDLLHGKQTL
jgi:hypothetical protein